MAKQNPSLKRSDKQNSILDLEKKYFTILENVFNSEYFLNDLLWIEKEIRENYPKFKATWNLKNKIKVPAERLVRHHVYTQLHELIDGIYPSPISSDLGIKTNDCILCIDVKTVDTIGNKVDLKSTQVEPNQISFDNKNHPYVQTLSNLESIDHYSRLPVLTFVIKIVYTDDDYSFKLSRSDKKSIILACIPNGELSELFNYDLIQNFKTYNYYLESENSDFKPVPIKNTTTKEETEKWAENYCTTTRNFTKTFVNDGSKAAYFDSKNKCIWWTTSLNNEVVLRAVKSGSTARLHNEMLRDRFDSKNDSWIGYKEFSIPDPKL